MLAEQMATLTASIAASQRDRSLAVEEIKAQTAHFISGAARTRKAMAQRLHSGLAAGARTRAHQVGAMRRANHKELQSVGRDLKHRLAQNTQRIASDVAVLLDSCSEARAAMAARQAEEFARDERARAKDALARAERTAVLMDGFTQARQDSARQLHQVLRANTEAICNDVVELKQGFNRVHGAVREDIRAAHEIWRARGGQESQRQAVRVSQSTARPPVPSVAETERGAVSRKLWELLPDDEKILRLLQQFSHGLSATEIGEKLSMSPMAVGKIIKGMIEKGEVSKDDNTKLFFPRLG